MENKLHEELAEKLYQAEKQRVSIAPLTAKHPELTVYDAYQIQNLNAERAIKENRRLVGYKVGLTSKVVQKNLGVDQPDFGHLYHDMSLLNESEVDLSQLIQPKIEAEVAFVLGKDLPTSGVSAAQVIQAVDYVTCAFEIVDSRIEDWKIKVVDTIADNGSSGRFVLAPTKTVLEKVDLAAVGLALSRRGEVEVTGSGAAVMGNPIHAVAFLANELGLHGKTMRAGDIVLSGSLSGMLVMKDGDFFTAEMWKLGKVSVSCKRRAS